MIYRYRTRGVCSVMITFEMDDGIVHNVRFERGCDGNAQGVGRLAEGMRAEEVVERLKGIRCDSKETSCPDQLARAIEAALTEASREEQKTGSL